MRNPKESFDIEMELFRIHTDGKSKMAYGLLTVTATAIGFSIVQTTDAWLGMNHIPLGIAIFLWGLSFYCGCLHLLYINNLLFVDRNLVKLGRISNPTSHDVSKIKSNETEAERWRKKQKASVILQFRFFLLGVTSFIVWHALEMYLRSVNTAMGG